MVDEYLDRFQRAGRDKSGPINPYIGVDSTQSAHPYGKQRDRQRTVLFWHDGFGERKAAGNGGDFRVDDGQEGILANWMAPTTSALMPSRDVAITATDDAGFKLTVSNGSGSGNYPIGATVNVSANAPLAGQVSARWTGDTVILADEDASRASTTALIPSSDVAIAATYAAGTTGTGLRGQYYNDGGSAQYPLANPFAGSPALTRTDATVDFNWGGNSPGSPVNPDNFSVKWTGQVKAPATGTYTFTVTADDGVRLFLGGETLVDAWRDQGPTAYSRTATLTAGTLYNIELHFYERGSGAECRLHWAPPGQSDQKIPDIQLYPSEGQEQVAAPVFNPAPGTYSSAQSVAITSATTDAIIRYTTDGSRRRRPKVRFTMARCSFPAR